MCVVSQDKECGRAIISTVQLAKSTASEVSDVRVDVAKLTSTVDVLVNSVNKLVLKHEEEEHQVIQRLKEKLNNKDLEIEENQKEMADKKKLADNRKWQIKLAVIVAILGFASSFAMFYIALHC